MKIDALLREQGIRFNWTKRVTKMLKRINHQLLTHSSSGILVYFTILQECSCSVRYNTVNISQKNFNKCNNYWYKWQGNWPATYYSASHWTTWYSCYYYYRCLEEQVEKNQLLWRQRLQTFILIYASFCWWYVKGQSVFKILQNHK